MCFVIDKDELIDCLQEQQKLKLQLAESEKNVEFFKEESKINKKDADYYFDEYRLCERELEEKKKEVAELKNYIGCKGCVDLIAKVHQDKISFCIEQLEKVKNEIYANEVSFEEIAKLPIALNNYEIGFDKGRFKAVHIIDNQIKELKEKNDD